MNAQTNNESDQERAKQIIVEIIRQSGGHFDRKTNLFKAFYHAHLKFAESNPGYLSFWPIVRMPYGPGIDNFDSLVGELLLEHAIHISSSAGKGMGFELTEVGAQRPTLSDDELSAIQYGVEMVEGKTATQVSNESHMASRSWQNTADGKELDIYQDTISEEKFNSWTADLAEMERAISNHTKV